MTSLTRRYNSGLVCISLYIGAMSKSKVQTLFFIRLFFYCLQNPGGITLAALRLHGCFHIINPYRY
jgi:hypothetical protein